MAKKGERSNSLPGIPMGSYCGHHLKWHPNHGNGRYGFFGGGEEGLVFLLCMILKMGTRLGHAKIHLKPQIIKSLFHSRQTIMNCTEEQN